MFCFSTIAAYTGSSTFGFDEPWFAWAYSGAIVVAIGFLFSGFVLFRNHSEVRLALLFSILGFSLVAWESTRLSGRESGLIAYGASALALGIALKRKRSVA